MMSQIAQKYWTKNIDLLPPRNTGALRHEFIVPGHLRSQFYDLTIWCKTGIAELRTYSCEIRNLQLHNSLAGV